LLDSYKPDLINVYNLGVHMDCGGDPECEMLTNACKDGSCKLPSPPCNCQEDDKDCSCKEGKGQGRERLGKEKEKEGTKEEGKDKEG